MTNPQTTLTEELRKCAGAVYFACHEDVAKDISLHLQRAANEIDRLNEGLRIISNTKDSTSGTYTTVADRYLEGGTWG